MNVAEAKQRARRQMSYGHFLSDGGVWNTCPDCKARLWVELRMGRPDLHALEARMVEHLADDCERA